MKRRTKEPGTHQRVYRYRCYPTPTQAEQLAETFGACRWIYNEGLALHANAWRDHGTSARKACGCTGRWLRLCRRDGLHRH